MSTLPQLTTCNCHFLDSNKTRILQWKHKTSPNTFLLKIGTQLFISVTRTDKNGEIYWKYRNFYENSETNSHPPELTTLEKFAQRQNKSSEINHERSPTELPESNQ